MSGINVKVQQQSIGVRVGQQNAVKIIPNNAISHVDTATNVIGGIGSITQLSVSGIASFNGDVYIGGNLSLLTIYGGSY
jgi:hypothetical protein